MDVLHVDQEINTPKRVCFDNSQGASSVTIYKGEILAYLLTGDDLNKVKKLSDTNTSNILFAGVARKKVVIPAYQKGYFEIDEPGSVTEALVLDAGVNGIAEYSTLIWQYHAASGGVLLEKASQTGCGAAVLLEAVDAADPAVVTLKKVYLDVGNRQVSEA